MYYDVDVLWILSDGVFESSHCLCQGHVLGSTVLEALA